MRRGLRTALLLLGIAALGLLVALAVAGPAAAFPEICNGTACHGSAIDTFAGAPVCDPGTATYWEDSYLPADAVNPHLAAFAITPKPPCTGATVGAPKIDPWPAKTPGPDGKPPKPPAGKADFRVTWTVTVPAGSKAEGTMSVRWTISWTKPAGTTEPVTTAASPAGRYDLAVTLDGPGSFVAMKAPQRIELRATYVNDGPAHSPTVDYSVGPSFYARLEGKDIDLPVTPVAAPKGCEQFARLECTLRSLAPNETETFVFALLWTTADRDVVEKARARKESLEIRIDTGRVNFVHCGEEETTCDNNEAIETVVPR